MPALIPCLIDQNVASRKDKGTSKGLEYFNKYINICNYKYKEYYILKCDVKGFFSSINHDILKQKIEEENKR